MSRGLSRATHHAAYARFTPNNSGQRSHPTSYRGCWHVVSRCFFLWYRHSSSHRKGVYTPKGVVPHAASLRQACAHCGKFLAAASRRSRGRVSVPVWLIVLSDQRPVIALVGHYPTNQLIGRRTLQAPPKCLLALPTGAQGYGVLPPVSRGYPPRLGRFPTCSSPVRHGRPPKGLPSDLHALGTPPALFLSQDQTLHQNGSKAIVCSVFRLSMPGDAFQRPPPPQPGAPVELRLSCQGAGRTRMVRVPLTILGWSGTLE